MDSIFDRMYSDQRKNSEKSGLEARKMSEKWQLNLMTLALAIGIILTWITWDPQTGCRQGIWRARFAHAWTRGQRNQIS